MEVNEFPTLHSVDSKGKVKIWTVIVLRNSVDQTATIRKIYGRDGEKMQVNDKTLTEGKNIGKANETTAYEQAVSEANSNWKKQTDKGYTEAKPEAGAMLNVKLPMLAHKFTQRKHNISYPAACQAKLNGVRCLAEKISDTAMRFTSKSGKSYDAVLQHLVAPLLKIMEVGEIFDGELYKHDWTFQKILKHTKKLQPTSSQLEFWIFDLADELTYYNNKIKTYEERHLILCDRLPKHTDVLHRVGMDMVADESGVKSYHDRYVENGYEGAMVRNFDGMYRFNYRSSDLQKYKEFEDKEFPIVGGHEGVGIEEGCVVFECVAENALPFSVRPKGTREKRQRWWRELEAIKGKQLTVRYQERSEDGIPIFPVGIAIRDYE